MIVIGNGESRKSLNLNLIQENKIGCNAAYRDLELRHLVCVDKRCLQEAMSNNFTDIGKLYTRSEHYIDNQKNLRLVPDLFYAGSERYDEPQHWGAGPYAVLLASKLTTSKHVKLVGFDLYGIDNKVNNVYKDTTNYSLSQKSAVDPSYWIIQLGKIFEFYSDVKYTIYNTEDWVMPKNWKKPNVSLDKLTNIV